LKQIGLEPQRAFSLIRRILPILLEQNETGSRQTSSFFFLSCVKLCCVCCCPSLSNEDRDGLRGGLGFLMLYTSLDVFSAVGSSTKINSAQAMGLWAIFMSLMGSKIILHMEG
jgi:hypothetical protein